MTYLDASVSWCPNCNVPIARAEECGLCHSKCVPMRVGGELRPIFPKEKAFLSRIIEKSLDISSFLPKGICFESRGKIIVDGSKVLRIRYDRTENEIEAILTRTKTDHLEGSSLAKMISANAGRIGQNERESKIFIDRNMKNDNVPCIVSFSGGKDSMCALSLAEESMDDVRVLFLNSTIEFPETVEFVHEVIKREGFDLIEILPQLDFFELCSEIGPPSVFFPWCCRTQKFAPLNEYINARFPEGVKSVEGLRKKESKSRSRYRRVSRNRTIPGKITLCPILDWTTLEVWLYILKEELPINPLYESGFNRIGCWVCPHRSQHYMKLTEIMHPELMKKWEDFLRNYSERNNKKEEWLKERKWRTRREPYEKLPILRKGTQGAFGKHYTYQTTKGPSLQRIFEFLKIFGEDIYSLADERYTVRGKGIVISAENDLIEVLASTRKDLRGFERQLLRAINCIGCGTCIGLCKARAITIADRTLRIDHQKCTYCLECMGSKHLRMGCIVLNYRKTRYVWEEDENPKS